MPVISDEELAEIAREFAPSAAEGSTDDLAYILRRGAATREGLGKTAPPLVRIGPYGAWVTYVGNMTVREKMEAGQLAAEGDYILSLPPGIAIYTSDKIQIWGRTWAPGLTVIAGSKIVPSDQRDQVFVCQNEGVLGTVEPSWPTVKPEASTVTDNGVVLQNTGTAPVYEIIQLASPNTFDDKFSTKLAANLKQDVRAT